MTPPPVCGNVSGVYGEANDYSELYGPTDDDPHTPLTELIGQQQTLTDPEIRIAALDATLRAAVIDGRIIGPGPLVSGFLSLAQTFEEYIRDGRQP